MSPRPSWLLFAVLFAVDGAVQILTFTLGPGPVVLDAEEYWVGAGDVAAGDWLQRSGRLDYRTPLYPIFVAVPRRFCGEYAHMAVVVSQHLLLLGANAVTAFVCWLVTRNRWAALGGYALAVLSLTRAWYANLVLTESLFTLLLTVAVGALIAYHQQPAVGRSALFGLFFGLTILVRPVPQWLWIPLLLLFFLHCSSATQRPRRFSAVLRHAATAAAVSVLLCAPWCARNWVLFGKPFLARLPAENKWVACFQRGSGGGLPIPNGPAGRRLLELIGTPNGDVPDRACQAVMFALRDKGLAKEERDQLVAAVCREAVRDNPWRFCWATFKRFVNFWRVTADGIPYSESSLPSQAHGQRGWRFEPIAAPYAVILRNTLVHHLHWNELVTVLLGLGTGWLVLRRPTREVGLSLAVIFGYFAAVTAAVVIENYRYRTIVEPLMIIAIVGGLVGPPFPSSDRES